MLKSELDHLKRRIDALKENREYGKGLILAESDLFCSTLATLLEEDLDLVRVTLMEYGETRDDLRMKELDLDRLNAMPAANDMRFGSLVLYVASRLKRPQVVVETGVAHGKSSYCLLLGLYLNSWGELISIDVPPNGSRAPDGTITRLHEREVGWLVPPELRDRWHLCLGDSLTELPKLLPGLSSIDIFIHDSLHTKEHTLSELRLVQKHMTPGGLIIVDDLHLGSGKAFRSYVDETGGVAHTLGTLGVVVTT